MFRFGDLAVIPRSMESFFNPSRPIEDSLFIYLCKVYEENPDLFHEEEYFAVLDTKKLDYESGEELYAYFTLNYREGADIKWYLKEFKTESQIQALFDGKFSSISQKRKEPNNDSVVKISREEIPDTQYIRAPEKTNQQGNKLEVDPIMRSILNKYRETHCPNEVKDGFIFSRLVNQLILEDDTPNCVENDEELLDAICVDDKYDLGIDGICIQVNGKIIRSVQHLESIIQQEHFINKAEIFLIQSKFKNEFKLEEFDSFASGIRQFFEEDPFRKINPKVENWHQIKNYLIDNVQYCQDMNHFNVRIFYAVYGEWNDSSEIMGDFDLLKKDIEAKEHGFYKFTKPYFVTADKIKQLANSNGRYFAPVIKVENNCLQLTDNQNLNGMAVKLKAKELLKILVDDKTDLLRKRLFDENVRDYQGDTKVNQAIKETLITDPQSFVIRNNGITILVSKFEAAGSLTTFKLENPQIVNGCQTCNVIYLAYREGIDLENVEIFARIISTGDQQAITNIVSANNNQNIVYDLIYEISKPYHKKLEEYFESYSNTHDNLKLYYERRSRSLQMTTLLGYQKCTFRNLIESAIAVWFDSPHKYAMNESTLLDDFKDRIFCEGQEAVIYFASALLFASYDKLIFEEKLDKEYRRCKPQVGFIIRYKLYGNIIDLNADSEKAMEVAKAIISLISKSNDFEKVVNYALNVFDIAKKHWIEKEGDNHKDDIFSNPKFNTYLLTEMQENVEEQENVQPVYSGAVYKISHDKHNDPFIIIQSSKFSSLFSHSKTSSIDFESLQTGDTVLFEIGRDLYGGNVAINVRKPSRE